MEHNVSVMSGGKNICWCYARRKPQRLFGELHEDRGFMWSLRVSVWVSRFKPHLSVTWRARNNNSNSRQLVELQMKTRRRSWECIIYAWRPIVFYKSVALTILELLAFNAQKFRVSRDPGHVRFTKKFQGIVHGLSLGTCVPNLKIVALTVLNWSDWPVRCTHRHTDRHTSNEHIISAIHFIHLPVKRQIAAVDAGDACHTVGRVGKHVVRVADERDAAVIVRQRRGADAIESEHWWRLLLLLLLPFFLAVTAWLQHPSSCQTLNAASVIRTTSLRPTTNHYSQPNPYL